MSHREGTTSGFWRRAWSRPRAGYGLVDLFASYAYNDRVSANFSVNNLLNREYTQFLNVEPNPGLTVKGGITIKFAER